MSEESKKPILQAGSQIIGRCPICDSKFNEKVATNIKHECPNPNCGISFTVMVFDE